MTWFDWAKEKKAKSRAKRLKVNFSPAAIQALGFAGAEARRLNHDYVGTEHLLLGLIKLDDGLCVGVFRKLNLQPEAVRKEIENAVRPVAGEPPYGNIPYTPRSSRVIELANKEAKAMNLSSASPEHLLLGLLVEGGGLAAKVLQSFDVNLNRMRSAILEKSPQMAPSDSST